MTPVLLQGAVWGYAALCDSSSLYFNLFLNDRFQTLFSSPEHEVLMVSYCDRAVSDVRRASSVVNFLPCVRSRGHSFGRILMKVGQDVCLDEISDEFENGSCGVKN